MAGRNASGRTGRGRAAAATGRFERVLGEGPRSRTRQPRATAVDVAADALHRMLGGGRPNCVGIV